uniref:Uncharacterized protein n=1 Tax=Arundo donax TaxID=35708 RepID=A0A0A8ZKR1_ARUDO
MRYRFLSGDFCGPSFLQGYMMPKWKYISMFSLHCAQFTFFISCLIYALQS